MMQRFVFCFTAVLILSANEPLAAKLKFSCDTATSQCTCDPNITGDCDAMKKNCVGGQILKCTGTVVIICSCASTKTNSAPDGTGASKKKNLETSQ